MTWGPLLGTREPKKANEGSAGGGAGSRSRPPAAAPEATGGAGADPLDADELRVDALLHVDLGHAGAHGDQPVAALERRDRRGLTGHVRAVRGGGPEARAAVGVGGSGARLALGLE